MFTDKPDPDLAKDALFQNKREEVIRTFARWVLGKDNAKPEDLVTFINEKVQLPHFSEIHWEARRGLKELCEYTGWPVPDGNCFTIHPVNSPACIIFWRVAVHLLRYLTVEQCREVRIFRYEQIPVVPTTHEEDLEEEVQTEPSVQLEQEEYILIDAVASDAKEVKGAVGGYIETIPPPSEDERSFTMVEGISRRKIGVVVSSLGELRAEAEREFYLDSPIHVYRGDVEVTTTRYLMKLPMDTELLVSDRLW